MGQSDRDLHVATLMEQSGVGFGTSGARGLVSAMTDEVCYAYVRAFLQHLQGLGQMPLTGGRVAVAGDLRPSTGRIMQAVAAAVSDAGHGPLDCGRIPSPAVALHGLAEGIPSVMVTGSHIPEDRNGIKFNRPDGEISKSDEAGIRTQRVRVPADRFDALGTLRPPSIGEPFPVDPGAFRRYVARYVEFFPPGALGGVRVGLYEHSTVARDAVAEVLTRLGARVVRFGRSESFVPVDTEAVRPEDVEIARSWAARGQVDALVSADGDGDRPLVGDETGEWLRGDVAGVLCARYLRADAVVTPVSSNTVVERCGFFRSVRRTRIGSPYVIAGMQEALERGFARVVGYEANGGFLTGSALEIEGRVLSPLPTRDALLVMAALLVLARRQGVPLSRLAADLPARFTASGRLARFPTDLSRARLAELGNGEDRRALERTFGHLFGPVAAVDTTDGLRITFASGEVVHLRPSGNAPELRCYNEAASAARAQEMNRLCLGLLEGWREKG
jgi:phosphomannomutase